jgi:uncharacterized phiE125 gp8 family phage protein
MSALAIVTGPTIEPVSLAEAKDHCRIDSAEQDGLLAGYLLAARQHVEMYTGRALMQQTFDAKFDFCWPRRCGLLEIPLPRPPKVSVTSIAYVDTAGATQTLSGSLYQLTERYGFGIIVPAYGQSWPTPRRQYDAITVRFVAGYGTQPGAVPEQIRQAILLLTSHFNENRELVNIGSTVTDIPMSVRALLASFVAEF